MLIATVAVLVIVYFMFFRKKSSAEKTKAPEKGTEESKYSAIPGTEPFDKTFMQPTSVNNARMAMMDAVSV